LCPMCLHSNPPIHLVANRGRLKNQINETLYFAKQDDYPGLILGNLKTTIQKISLRPIHRPLLFWPLPLSWNPGGALVEWRFPGFVGLPADAVCIFTGAPV
jgi:hypothetical protein